VAALSSMMMSPGVAVVFPPVSSVVASSLLAVLQPATRMGGITLLRLTEECDQCADDGERRQAV
jgi:hypothetical protein